MFDILSLFSDRNLLFQGGVGRGTGIGERGGLINFIQLEIGNQLESLFALSKHSVTILILDGVIEFG